MPHVLSKRRLGLVWVVSLACGVACQPAWADAQADRIDALEQRLARSVQIIEQLSSRVTELERQTREPASPMPVAKAAQPPLTPNAGEEQAKSIAALQESVNQIAEGLSRNSNDTGIPVHGFIDVGGGWSSSRDPQRLRGFNAGSLDLYLTPQIGARVKALVELVAEFEDNNDTSVDMERIQVGYTFSDALTVWAGRFHAPLGLWNTSFHHGANLQTSITRPKLVEFEDRGGLVPVHAVGLWASGKTSLGDGKLTYDGYLTNGPSIHDRKLAINTFNDDNGNKMLGFNLGYKAGGEWTGLTVGLHGFASNVGSYSNPGALRSTTRVRAHGAYFGYDSQDWEAIGEYYSFHDADVDGGPSRSSNASFVHVGRTFGALTPFARYEHASLDPRDNYFRGLETGRPFSRAVLGARYAIDANSSLKLELSRSRESAATQLDETGALVDSPSAAYRRALVQYSIAF